MKKLLLCFMPIICIALIGISVEEVKAQVQTSDAKAAFLVDGGKLEDFDKVAEAGDDIQYMLLCAKSGNQMTTGSDNAVAFWTVDAADLTDSTGLFHTGNALNIHQVGNKTGWEVLVEVLVSSDGTRGVSAANRPIIFYEKDGADVAANKSHNLIRLTKAEDEDTFLFDADNTRFKPREGKGLTLSYGKSVADRTETGTIQDVWQVISLGAMSMTYAAQDATGVLSSFPDISITNAKPANLQVHISEGTGSADTPYADVPANALLGAAETNTNGLATNAFQGSNGGEYGKGIAQLGLYIRYPQLVSFLGMNGNTYGIDLLGLSCPDEITIRVFLESDSPGDFTAATDLHGGNRVSIEAGADETALHKRVIVRNDMAFGVLYKYQNDKSTGTGPGIAGGDDSFVDGLHEWGARGTTGKAYIYYALKYGTEYRYQVYGVELDGTASSGMTLIPTGGIKTIQDNRLRIFFLSAMYDLTSEPERMAAVIGNAVNQQTDMLGFTN